MSADDRPITPGGRHRVAVYGTLKRGERNHALLRGADFLGVDYLTTITLYDLGPYPGAREEASDGVEVEVYGVSPSTFAALDELEDFNPRARRAGNYDRRVMTTAHGPAWVYLYNHSVRGCPCINAGGWSADLSFT